MFWAWCNPVWILVKYVTKLKCTHEYVQGCTLLWINTGWFYRYSSLLVELHTAILLLISWHRSKAEEYEDKDQMRPLGTAYEHITWQSANNPCACIIGYIMYFATDKHIVTATKWSPFCRRHCPMHLKWNFTYVFKSDWSLLPLVKWTTIQY